MRKNSSTDISKKVVGNLADINLVHIAISSHTATAAKDYNYLQKPTQLLSTKQYFGRHFYSETKTESYARKRTLQNTKTERRPSSDNNTPKATNKDARNDNNDVNSPPNSKRNKNSSERKPLKLNKNSQPQKPPLEE